MYSRHDRYPGRDYEGYGTANRAAGPGTIGMAGTATVMVGTTEPAGTGVIVGALRGRASRPSRECTGATRGVLRGVAAWPGLRNTMRPRAHCLLTVTVTRR